MIDVTCAIIRQNQNLLAVKRSRGMHLAGKWEFPGGKTEKDETTECCIAREIDEELGIGISILKPLIPVVHHYPGKSIRLIPFLCEIQSGRISLNEHEDLIWISKNELATLDWAEADRKIIKINEAILESHFNQGSK
jgi:8-oxo-dGTP diphosphatase